MENRSENLHAKKINSCLDAILKLSTSRGHELTRSLHDLGLIRIGIDVSVAMIRTPPQLQPRFGSFETRAEAFVIAK
jgi:hypothetical protein